MSNSHEKSGRRLPAELRDAGGDVVSRGEALFFPDDTNSANFYPRDLAPRETIQSRAKTLVLVDENESRAITAIMECPEEVRHELHFHVRLS